MKEIGNYRNGNYNVKIFDDGTKIRYSKEDEFKAEFPECMDIKITNYCDRNCKMCHENSTIEGKHGDILNVNFINTLNPYTEIALGGGNPLSHPDLVQFLKICRSKRIIVNMTVNQIHFMNNLNFIDILIERKLIHGLGVSLVSATDDFFNELNKRNNTVLHIINGLINEETLNKLYNKNLKILILGYKQFRRGVDLYNKDFIEIETNKLMLYNNLKTLIEKSKVVSFDNLAIEQLRVKRLMSEEEWNEFYMGDDGKFTMYIDLVNKQFAKCSISTQRYDLLDNINDMFEVVLKED